VAAFFVLNLLLAGVVLGQDAPKPTEPDAAKPKPTKDAEGKPVKEAADDKEVVVTATRSSEEAGKTPRGISTVDEDGLERRGPSASTNAEYLKGEPGVFVQQTGRRGGAPIIRGMIGKYILPLYDGVRLTDGTIFAGPNAFFNGVDRFTIRRIEIVRGPASLFYGSDALGGTLQMFPKHFDGFPDEFDYGIGLESRYRTVNNQFSQRLELSGGISPVNLFLGGTFVNGGDSRGGGTLGRTYNTSWTEWNADARMGVELAAGHTLELAYVRAQRDNVYRYDQPWETPKMNDWWEAHQSLYLTGSGLRKRQNRSPIGITQIASVTYRGENPTPFWDEVIAKFYWRGEYGQSVSGAEQATTRTESTSVSYLNVYGLSAQFSFPMFEDNHVSYGVDSRLDDVYAGRTYTTTFDKASGDKIGKAGGTPGNPAARFLDVGVFVYDEYKGISRLTLSGGVRFNYSNIESRPNRRTVPSGLSPSQLELDADFTSFTWATGAVWEIIDEFSVVANVGTGFKSPSISDTLSTGPFTFGVSVPSPDLKPEESVTYEGGVKSRFDRFSGSLMAYYTDLRNLIESHPGTFDGSDFIDLNGDATKQPDEQVYVNVNEGRAYIWGVEAAFDWEFLRTDSGHSLFWFANGTFTRGASLTAHEPLRFIPPLNGRVGLRWEVDTGWKYASRAWVEFEAPWSLDKPKKQFAADDLADLAQFPREPGHLPGWVILNLRAGMDVTEFAALSFSITNMFNTEYQSFGSRLPADGFSLDIGLRLQW